MLKNDQTKEMRSYKHVGQWEGTWNHTANLSSSAVMTMSL